MKITFLGAGSTVFAKNVLGDVLLTPTLLENLEIALYDISAERLDESYAVIESLNQKYNNGIAKIDTFLGVENRKSALRGAKFVPGTIASQPQTRRISRALSLDPLRISTAIKSCSRPLSCKIRITSAIPGSIISVLLFRFVCAIVNTPLHKVLIYDW